ncbi:hypothetical protein [Falsirhodobacter halotolerans]|uniref:hypothetical protein n=1 Tax=Falsirhodobacter halotolerans TaxID=1146892 RepID=UPI001FD4A97C|nr:hypothetical protein [Falsirhodobacter halotolerans]MCJ8139492.1 hypothetical protein [Falsirhodobacter halotolerans]
MTAPTPTQSETDMARSTLYSRVTTDAERKAAVEILSHSTHTLDRFLIREVGGSAPSIRPDMAQITPDDPPKRLEPGGPYGWAAVIAIATIFFAAIAIIGSLSIAPDATKHFLTFGGRIQ